MRVLIISFNFSKTSSGKITERLADQLQDKGYNILVLCAHNYSNSLKKYKIVTVSPFPNRPVFIFKFVGRILKRYLVYISWISKIKIFFRYYLKGFIPDLIYSRGSPYASYPIGRYISLKTNAKHIIHFADPIPAPISWLPDLKERDILLKEVFASMQGATLLTFATREIMKYQLSTTPFPESLAIELFNPIPDPTYLGQPTNSTFIFTYFGTFNLARNAQHILVIFDDFFTNNEGEFHIYGNNSHLLNIIDELNNKDRFHLKNYSYNILEVFRGSNILVDVDSDDVEQIFISGKLVEYLSYDRFILSITTRTSPAARILSEISNSVILSTHDRDRIYNSLIRAKMVKYSNQIFSDRQEIFKKYSAEANFKIVEKFLKS